MGTAPIAARGHAVGLGRRRDAPPSGPRRVGAAGAARGPGRAGRRSSSIWTASLGRVHTRSVAARAPIPSGESGSGPWSAAGAAATRSSRRTRAATGRAPCHRRAARSRPTPVNRSVSMTGVRSPSARRARPGSAASGRSNASTPSGCRRSRRRGPEVGAAAARSATPTTPTAAATPVASLVSSRRPRARSEKSMDIEHATSHGRTGVPAVSSRVRTARTVVRPGGRQRPRARRTGLRPPAAQPPARKQSPRRSGVMLSRMKPRPTSATSGSSRSSG